MYEEQLADENPRTSWKQELQLHVNVDLSSTPFQGDVGAPHTLIEFVDYKCPYCLSEEPLIGAFFEHHKARLRIAYINLPLHPQSADLARAAWAAQQQGKFIEYHDLLFGSFQETMRPQDYRNLAASLGLNIRKFEHDRRGNQSRQSVDHDSDVARQLGISATPMFILNGIILKGSVPVSEFEEALETAEQNKQARIR